MIDQGDSKFLEHQPGIVLRAALIPRFGFFAGEAGPLTFSPAIEFGGSAEVERGASVLPLWKNVILPRQRRSIRAPKAKGDSCNKRIKPVQQHQFRNNVTQLQWGPTKP